MHKIENKNNKKIKTEFQFISYGPNHHSLRLIWVSAKTSKEIFNLKQEIQNSLEIKTDNREFLLHLTLGRFRENDFENFTIKNLNERLNYKEIFDKFVLLESKLSPKGAQYSLLDSFKI